jgi:Ran GTPase-activating protein (RanGAP) involved in mRNA processing and transport
VGNLDGLDAVLLCDNSKITELEIYMPHGDPPMMGLKRVLQALARRPTLTKLGLRYRSDRSFDRDEARLLGLALCNTRSLQTLALTWMALRSAGLAELAPALYRNTSIKVLDMSHNCWNYVESAEILREILRSNKTITTLDLSANRFGRTIGAVECIADGLGSNSTLLNIDLSSCDLGDGGISTLARNIGSRNTTLQKLILGMNSITSTGVGVLLETMEQSCHHITDLDLHQNPIGNEGARLLARSLGNNALPNLTHLSLYDCDVSDDGFIALMSALEQNKSLLHLDLRSNLGHRAFLALAESLPEIKVLQRLDVKWDRFGNIGFAMPLLLEGLRKNTSLFRFHVDGCAPVWFPPTTEDTPKFAGGWMQEVERLGYRNYFRSLIRAPKDRLPPRGVWSQALARVTTLPDVTFEVLRSNPKLVPSEDAEGKEAAEDTGGPKKRKRGDE